MTFSVFFVALIQICYYITLFGFIPLGIIFRFFIVWKSPLTKGMKALVIFDFTSLSFFANLGKGKNLKIYTIFLLISLVVAALGFSSGIHIYF